MTGRDEMDNTIDSILATIRADAVYRKMFRSTFGNDTINTQRMLWALAQFTGNIVSANAKYDKMKKGKAVFNDWEQQGYIIFKERCAVCHTEPLFTDFKYHNIGLAVDTFLNDFGRMVITNDKKIRFCSKHHHSEIFPVLILICMMGDTGAIYCY